MRDIINSYIEVICKSKTKNFILWYIFAYLASICYGYFRYKWDTPMIFFPIKLFPFIVAKFIGGVFYKSIKKESYSPKEIKRDVNIMFIIILLSVITGVLIYKFTGIYLIWMII